MFWFICTAQFKGLRYTVGCVLVIGCCLFQCLSFLVFGDQFCKIYQCKFGRSAGFSVGAAACYFVAGKQLLPLASYKMRTGRTSVGVLGEECSRVCVNSFNFPRGSESEAFSVLSGRSHCIK